MLEGFTQGINIRIIGSSNLAGTMGEAVSQMDRFKAVSYTHLTLPTN